MHDAADGGSSRISTSPRGSTDGRDFSTQMPPMPPARTSLANFFSPLVNNVEQMYLTGKETPPVERTLLTTGLTAAGVESSSANRSSTRHRTLPSRIRPRRCRPSGEPK